MRKIFLGLFGLILTFPCWADVSLDPLFNKVTMQLTAEQWVTTKTALVNVSVNAAVSDTTLEKIHSQVLDKLNKLSNKGEWHLVSYDRSQDKSGLESVKIIAQARLPEAELAGLRDRAKGISKPGETYAIDSIQFTPSDEEIREANNNLRANIYDQIKAELARLSKAYPDQKYVLHDVNFMSDMSPMPMMATGMMYKANDNGAARAPLTVGDKLRLMATVVLSANPDPNLLKSVVH